MIWTPEMIERLKDMRALGNSMGQIARALGVTRSAVGGKISRLELPLRSPEKSKHQTPRPTVPRQVQVAKEVIMPSQEQAPQSLKIALLEARKNQCRWITSDEGEADICGHPQKEHRPYCEYHCAKAYQPALPARRKDGIVQ